MIYVHVTYSLKPDKTCSQFYNELLEAKILERIHKNPGCINYDFSYPADGSTDKLYLLECWKDQESMDTHGQQEYRKEQMALREKYCVNVDIKRFKEFE